MSNPYDTANDNSHEPRYIERYRVERTLGKGGFGVVYLASDERLQRFVAIKMPRAELITRPEDTDAYLAEARIVAALDHPNIVPGFAVASTAEPPFLLDISY